MIKEIKTIRGTAESKFKEKGSVFNGFSALVETEEEAEEFLTGLKKKFYYASHHCFAFRLDKNIFRYSDAGEPNGTAGIRILNAIDHFELFNIIIVVVRYFGGTKLGSGPLGKAYYNSAIDTIKNSEIIIKKAYKKLLINSDFSYLNSIQKLISETDSKIINSEYSDKVKLEILIPPDAQDKFSKHLTEISANQIVVKSDENIIFA